MKYQKKPVVIEARQWDGTKESATELLRWMFPDIEPDAEASTLTVKTLEGELRASPNDFIIRGIKGEFYPCKPDIFEATYEIARSDVRKLDENGKLPYLFYYEEGENCWAPAPTELENIVNLDHFTFDGDKLSVEFQRCDMTPEQFENLPVI